MLTRQNHVRRSSSVMKNKSLPSVLCNAQTILGVMDFGGTKTIKNQCASFITMNVMSKQNVVKILNSPIVTKVKILTLNILFFITGLQSTPLAQSQIQVLLGICA